MKTKLCKMFVLITVLCLSISSMTLVASAEYKLKDNELIVTNENITKTSTQTMSYSNGTPPSQGTSVELVKSFTFNDLTQVCTNNRNSHDARLTSSAKGYYYTWNNHGSPHYTHHNHGYSISVSGTQYSWPLGTALYSLKITTGPYVEYYLIDPSSMSCKLYSCTRCKKQLPGAERRDVFMGTTSSRYASRVVEESYTYYSYAVSLKSVQLTSCITNGATLAVPTLTVKSGSYSGAPAINASTAVVLKATITDTDGKHSAFLIGEDSEQTVTTSDNKTITTVKLSNPPVIIDWADFPG